MLYLRLQISKVRRAQELTGTEQSLLCAAKRKPGSESIVQICVDFNIRINSP